MLIRDTATGEEYEAIIEPLTKKDFITIRKNRDRFDEFDWSECQGLEVYKLRLVDDKTILGLMCLVEHSDESIRAIQIDLLEVSRENKGSGKKLDNIAGCLIAFACREAFERKYEGCVFLVPKTELLHHYNSKYGFYHMPLRTILRPEGIMIIYEQGSRKLINKYLEK